MDDAQLGQLETQLLKLYMPGISKAHCKALRRLCKEKGVKIYSTKLKQDLTNLLASIIRHRETLYDQIVSEVGKERARFYIQHEVKNKLGHIG